MQVPMVDLQAQYAAIKGDVDRAIEAVLRSQHFILGPEVRTLESEMAALVGTRHAIGCASGTDALLLPLMALRAEPGSEVIVPAFTFFATAGAVWNAGLKPVFCDVDPSTFNVTVDTVAPACTDRTVAVIVVHLFGQMAPMEPLVRWAAERGITIIEDAAQGIGAMQTAADGQTARHAGSIGRAGTFSFFPTKNLGAYGDAGLVTTDDDDMAERVAALRVHGGLRTYHHDYVGTNSRLDTLQAAVLGAKLKHLPSWTRARRDNAAHYDSAFADLPEVITPAVGAENQHVYHQYTLRTRERDGLRAYLTERGIATGVYYPVPLHLQPCFRALGYRPGSLPVSETLAEQVVSLPVYPELGADRRDLVVSGVRGFYGSRVRAMA